MLKIRYQRTGRKNDPAFRIVVIEHTRGPKSGDFIEKLGSYHPKTKDVQLNAERIQYWLGNGAQASGTVHNLLVTHGVVKGDKINVLPKKTAPEPEPVEEETPTEEVAEEAATEEADAPAEETPAEEAPAEEATEEGEEK